MSRRTAHDVLKVAKVAFEAAGLNGHLATHSLRKSFAQRLYDRTGDIFAVQEMLGHRNVSTTQSIWVSITPISRKPLRKWRYLLNCTKLPFWAVHWKDRRRTLFAEIIKDRMLKTDWAILI